MRLLAEAFFAVFCGGRYEMEELKLEKNAKVFQMANGKQLIISNEDYRELATAITAEMLVNGDNRVYLIKDVALERAKLMQKIFNDSKEEMNEKTKNKYLQEIIGVLKSNDYDIITFKQHKDSELAAKSS